MVEWDGDAVSVARSLCWEPRARRRGWTVPKSRMGVMVWYQR